MWNNRGDVAVLFDANGLEIDRCAYGHARKLGNTTQRRKRLLRDGETWRMVDEPMPETKAHPLKNRRPSRR